MTTVGEQRAQDALSRLPEGLGRVSGFLELIEMDLRGQTAGLRRIEEAIYTLAMVQAVAANGGDPDFMQLNRDVQDFLYSRDLQDNQPYQPITPREENP